MGLLSWLFGAPEEAAAESEDRGSMRADHAVKHPVRTYASPTARVQWERGRFPIKAVGEINYQVALLDITGGPNRNGYQMEMEAVLQREYDNPYDANAVVVEIKGLTVGYLPRDQAARVSSQMKRDGISGARCIARLIGGWPTKKNVAGHFGVRLGVPKRGWIDFGLGKSEPQDGQ